MFELCLLELYGEFLYSCDLQFGFKKQLSCSHSIYVMRKVVDYFVSNGSTVNLCSLDITKAFDKGTLTSLSRVQMQKPAPKIQPLSITIMLTDKQLTLYRQDSGHKLLNSTSNLSWFVQK